ncbi:MAG TPA: PEP/pyruvate-binding domain-containing protein [Anaerolineae bacterium]|nr:PEP/pyruvate-binding domain-containing protein [Anaerolineae bacterium]
MAYLRFLDQVSAQDTALAGGKGANLGELARAGFPVPPGFVLTTAAYRAFVETNNLQEIIGDAIQATDPEDPTELERAATTIASHFIAARMPAEIADELCRAYRTLGQGPVAVRSSATAEDLPEASFAGQQETLLNVTSEEAVLEAVKRCWASLWTARAIAYRAKRAIPSGGVALAVVVQRMVAAEMAGVLFTANPANRDPDEMVVNASRGLGEAVVSGQVTPEEIVVNRRRWKVRRRSGAPRQVLSDPQALDLARLGEQIETHYGRPQDIEWALADGRFHILQARPITTPIRPRLTWKPPMRGLRYMRGGATEMMPDPVSVLFETLGLPAIEQATKEYQQIGTGQAAQAWQNWGFVTINGYVYGWLRLKPAMILTTLLYIPRLLRYAGQAFDIWERETLPNYKKAVTALQGDPAAFSAQELLERIADLALACGRYWASFAGIVPRLDQNERRFALLYQKLRRKDEPEPAVFLRGLENRPLEADLALYAARAGDLDETVARYGHVVYNLDFAVPLAGEDRAGLEAMRRAWVEGAPSPDERYAQLAAEREAATRRIRQRLPDWKRRLFDKALATAQRTAQLRENALFDLGLAWMPLRQYALELGRRLVEAGTLTNPQQVFWLRYGELTALAGKLDRQERPSAPLAEQAEARRAEREAARGARIPFTIPERTARGLASRFVPTAEGRRQAEGNVLTGAGTSPGRVTAVARVIHGSEEFNRLGRGDILVAHATTPAWTPLFALAGGLVADLGGTLSHGSIVAREYGIPAVMGTGNGTERICDGQVVTVDGAAGKVYLSAV